MQNLDLAQKLISIPSYVGPKTNESILGEFILNYIRKYTSLTIIKQQPLPGSSRFNLIVSDGYPPNLIFISHMDTVYPSGNTQSMLTPRISQDQLLGLGAADMKGGMASLLTAVSNFNKTQGLTLIFDCDEESYFKGIKQILKSYCFQPQLVVCPEPTDGKIINGCRGVIEIEFTLKGKTAHASMPEKGVNSIIQSVRLVNRLTQFFSQSPASDLGQTSVNLAYLNGGLVVNSQIINQPNCVPNQAYFTLDIRPANPKINANLVIDQAINLAKPFQLTVSKAQIKLDYPSYFTPKSQLQTLETVQQQVLGKVSYQKLDQAGFFESAIVSRSWNCPAVNFGPTGTFHNPNEYVSLASLNQCQQVYQQLIQAYCTP